MSLAPDLLELLRCPQSGQQLAAASPELLAKLEAQRRAGTLVVAATQPQWDASVPLETVLIREDGRVGYAVQDGIPILLPDHAMAIPSEY